MLQWHTIKGKKANILENEKRTQLLYSHVRNACMIAAFHQHGTFGVSSIFAFLPLMVCHCNILLYLFTKHIHKTKHRVTRTPYKPGVN
jgi:hypothetical protein